MALFKSSNPALRASVFENVAGTAHEADAMTVQGTINKSATLLLILVGGAAFSWWFFLSNMALGFPLLIGGSLAGFVVALVIHFKKTWAPFLAPVYAAVEGVVLGAISLILEFSFPGMVLSAIMLTIAVFAVMLIAYKTRLIEVTQQFRTMVVVATAAIALVYLVSMLLNLFGMQVAFIHDTGTIGIVFSLFVVGIAALNLVLDFDFIERGAAQGVPKYMEWYAAFGLLVTLVWLYLEILRLLSKLRGR